MDDLRRNKRVFEINLRNIGWAEEIRKNCQREQGQHHQHTDNRDFVTPEATPDQLKITFVCLVLNGDLFYRGRAQFTNSNAG